MENIRSFNQSTSLLESTVEMIDFESYQALIENAFYQEDLLEESLLQLAKDQLGHLKKAFSDIKKYFLDLSEKFGVALKDLISGLKSLNMFSILKFFGFSVSKLIKVLLDASSLWRRGLMKVFEEIAKTRLMEKVNQGLVKIDDVLARYPILKKLTGPLVAGVLVYIWLNMTFIGDLDYDFNFSDVVGALGGSFSLESIFGGSSGLMLMTLFATGGYISAPWLGSTAGNLTLALLYTSLRSIQNSDNPALVKIRKSIKINQ